MHILFISDLHLAPETAANVRAFAAFLSGPARQADAVYILGDLFEYWLGDDDLDTPFNAQLLELLRGAVTTGTRLYFLAGNRDFLVASRFAEESGVTLLPDPYLLEADGQRLLLSHGDALCTDDAAYQAYRLQVRNPQVQAMFLAKPIAERRIIIEDMRARSEQAKQGKAYEIMDVNAEALAALWRAHDYPVLIHGHTHRPAQHMCEIDGHHCTRWVLADWRGEMSYLSCENGHFAWVGPNIASPAP